MFFLGAFVMSENGIKVGKGYRKGSENVGKEGD
jgi:hypothetical protein